MTDPESLPSTDLTVDQAVRLICLELEPVAKTARSAGAAAYNYRGRDQVVDALSPLLARYGVSVIPSGVCDVTTEWVTDSKDRVERLVCGFYSFDVRGPNGDSYRTQMYSEGMNSRDKASGAAMSYAYRYALEMIFALPTSAAENEDRDEPVEPTVTAKQAKALADVFGTIDDVHARAQAKQAFVGAFGAPEAVAATKYGDALKWAMKQAATAAHSPPEPSGDDQGPDTPQPGSEGSEGPGR